MVEKVEKGIEDVAALDRAIREDFTEEMTLEQKSEKSEEAMWSMERAGKKKCKGCKPGAHVAGPWSGMQMRGSQGIGLRDNLGWRIRHGLCSPL